MDSVAESLENNVMPQISGTLMSLFGFPTIDDVEDRLRFPIEAQVREQVKWRILEQAFSNRFLESLRWKSPKRSNC